MTSKCAHATLPPVQRPKLTVDSIRQMKAVSPVSALTAYDFPTARLLDEAGVHILLVGDSLGMVVLGYPDTTHVTLDHMVHHTQAVARANPTALIGGDLPIDTYRTLEEAVQSARRLRAAGADFVKAEGGREILPQIEAIMADGIPFCGHLGMLPQHVLEEGGKYRIKGRDDDGRQHLLEDAAALNAIGVFACVLELVTPPVAAEITHRCARMVTVGIGSGADCDGQILVTPDLVGGFPWFTPRFVAPRAKTGQTIRDIAASWVQELRLPLQELPAAGNPG